MKTLLLLQAQQQERDLPAVGIAPREQQVPSTTHAPGAVLSQRGMNGRELAPAAGNGKGRGRELGGGGGGRQGWGLQLGLVSPELRPAAWPAQ